MTNQLRVPTTPGKPILALERWFGKRYAGDRLFNPDDCPEDIISMLTGEASFGREDCQGLNESVERLFKCHGDKVYEVVLQYFFKTTGIDPEYAAA